MEKKTIHSGAPFFLAGAGVLATALILGMGTLPGYIVALGAGAGGFAVGKRYFPDREIEVESAPKSGDAQVDALICEARVQLEAIVQANEAIAEPALSAQIADIEATCRRILLCLEEQPSMLGQLRTFLRYYLPATKKLLDARAKLEDEVSAGESAQIAEKIRAAMATVQTALHKQLDALTEFRFINLESEMDTLSAMLRADGLTGETDAAPQQEQPKQEEDPFAGLF